MNKKLDNTNSLSPFMSFELQNITSSKIENIDLLSILNKNAGLIIKPLFSNLSQFDYVLYIKNWLKKNKINNISAVHIFIIDDNHKYTSQQIYSSTIEFSLWDDNSSSHNICIKTVKTNFQIDPCQQQASMCICKPNLSFLGILDNSLQVSLSALYPSIKLQLCFFA